MLPALLLWIDLTTGEDPVSLRERLAAYCSVCACTPPDRPAQRITELKPDIICFDCNQPTDAERSLIKTTKLNNPSIPILMFTDSRSTDLLVWALRTRVWDCFIKPVSCGEVVRRLNLMLTMMNERPEQQARAIFLPERTSASIALALPDRDAGARTAAALDYAREHFHERIALADVARLCGLSPFEFSRTFKREQGLTFQGFLIHKRIQAAAATLLKTEHSVIDVASAVGFNDPSYFTRQFRRAMGVTPSAYRRHAQRGTGATPIRP